MTMHHLKVLLADYGIDISRPLSDEEGKQATKVLVELAEILWPAEPTPENIEHFREYVSYCIGR